MSVKYVLGQENSWVDTLSRLRDTSMEWQLRPQVFITHSLLYGLLQINLFAPLTTAQLPLYLSFNHRTRAGGPNTFMKDWNHWHYIYLFPPPATLVLLKVMQALRLYRGRVLLIAPYWPA